MFGVTTSDDYQPVTWVGRHPSMSRRCSWQCTLLRQLSLVSLAARGVLGHLAFDSALVWQRGEFWQLATYAFVHSPSGLLWFAVEMYMLFVFGREVERFIGRRAFIVLYLLFSWRRPLLLSLWGLGTGRHRRFARAPFRYLRRLRHDLSKRGVALPHPGKWVALALAAISTLQLLAYRDWPECPFSGLV